MKPKFKRLRKLVKVVKQVPNKMFDMDRFWSDAHPRCALGHLRTSPKFAKQVKRHNITGDSDYYEVGVNVFNLSREDSGSLFSGAGESKFDEFDAYEHNDGKAGKKLFKRRVRKLFAEYGKVL